MKADIFDIYRGTTHDGPGLRSTVFFRGCPLNCKWCHNPEGISAKPYTWWDPQRCIGCESCITNCPAGAITATAAGIHISGDACIQCGLCARNCPTKAMELISRQYTTDELLNILRKDKDYYLQFHGGVTASGGEALLHAPFVAELFQKLQSEGIHTALDTCGNVPYSAFQQVLPYTDCILYDLKLADPSAHRLHTNADNGLILQNFHTLMTQLSREEKPRTLWIRTPLIPGATDSEQNIRQIADIILPYCGKTLHRWELCAFNNICEKKYRRLEKNWIYSGTPLLNAAQAQQLLQVALESIGNSIPVVLTGMLR